MKLLETLLLLEGKYRGYPKKYFRGVPKKQWSSRADWFDSKKRRLQRGSTSQYGEVGPGQNVSTKKSVYTRWYEKKYGVGHSLQEKSSATGVLLSTLKEVYKRGVGAWSTGHRAGATPQQWGHARVSAYLYKVLNKKKLNHDTDLPVK